VPTVDLGKEEYELALKINQRESYSYIGQNVKIKIDRPLNSKHPKHGFIYQLNYGYVPNAISGDGEELDCYLLGVDKPVEDFEGRCIAVIHRTNDDDKLVIVPDGIEFTDEEIRKLTEFQEQYFESEIIR
ncbi:MAG: inorganic diphosphatase, partial [Clostridia bacterium]